MTSAAAGDDGLLRPAPFLSSLMQIEPQWIDYNGHLNMAYYNVMFDRAIDELWLKLGIGPGYMRERQGSTFTAECHVRYLREIHLGDPLQVSILLVGADEKRLHTFEELRHASEGWLSATSENMTIHIDMTAIKKMTLAISIEAPAMPPKPKMPAIRAMIRKVTTQLSMFRTSVFLVLFDIGATMSVAHWL